ncbi:MAG: hypothetical protein M3P26_06955 [Gemmatimonadota bacterium]|nr:hypothetical protein [Gemmatimonadota bacterium]
MGQLRSVRLKAALLISLLLLAACKRESRDGARVLTASLIFDNASPEVREALASRVDFRINDDNFARWEQAQRNLEKLPRSAIPATSATRGNAVDRAVARLESSPFTRRAIESAGLSVREFVLETIALAQATEAVQTGKSMSRGPIPPENFNFVQQYNARALYSHPRVARAEAESYDMESEPADVMTNQAEMDLQMQLDDADHQAEMQLAELEMRREELERAAEMQREEAERAAEIEREVVEHQAEMLRVQAEHAAEVWRDRADAKRERDITAYRERAQRERDSMVRRRRFRLVPSRDSARDSVRDTLPTLR